MDVIQPGALGPVRSGKQLMPFATLQRAMAQTTLFETHDHKYNPKDYNEEEFCACPQIYDVQSNFRSEQFSCFCPFNYQHAIYLSNPTSL